MRMNGWSSYLLPSCCCDRKRPSVRGLDSGWSHQLEALGEVSKALADAYEPVVLMGLVAERIRELVDARFVYVALRVPDGSLEITAAAGEGAADVVGRRLDPAHSKSAAVMQRRRGERLDSMLDDPEADRSLAHALGTRAAIFVPLLAGSEPIGAIAVNDHTGADPRFSEADYRLVQELADRAAIALDLSQRVERHTVLRILEAQELERKRLARELHDETGQALTAILLGLKPLEATAPATAGSLRELVKNALASVRKLSIDLRPAVLDDFGLVAALERVRDDLNERSDLTIGLTVVGLSERLPEDIETMLYRVAQEAVANAVRHAEARTIQITLERSHGEVISLTVTDDGRGFDPELTGTARFGLVGMRERTALLGGAFHIDSTPGQGTRISATIRLRPSAPSSDPPLTSSSPSA